VEMVGGRLELSSEIGRGTRAEVRVPLERSVMGEGVA
jgi:signal transduction histidine kinase